MGSVLLIILSVVLLIDAFLLVTCILLQEDKSGGGIGMIGGSSSSFFGANSSSILSKITTVLLTIFIILIIVMGLISSSFTKGSNISAQDIADIESLEYTESVVSSLKELPRTIRVSDFENSILAKIDNEEDKTFIQGIYEKNKQNKYFELNEKAVKKQEAKKRALDILNGIGFSLEAKTINVNSSLSNPDATND